MNFFYLIVICKLFDDVKMMWYMKMWVFDDMLYKDVLFDDVLYKSRYMLHLLHVAIVDH
jgi:hypothetical protein